jgi:23S rRNA pseudouridine1911/1915/1917 synthase
MILDEPEAQTQDPQFPGPRQIRQWVVEPEQAGQRIDLFLALQCDGYSRVFLRKVLHEGSVWLDGKPVKPSFKVQIGQTVKIDLPPPPDDGPIPEAIPIDILYEDDAMVVINKVAGMVVHPAKGHWSGTLTSALAHHFQSLSDVGGPTRPGIVHRLDRETSGVICIAKTNAVHLKLAAQFEAREVEKEYWAIAVGSIDRDRDWIRQPIGHHPYQRDKMAIRADHPSSRPAETLFEVVKRFPGYCFFHLFPKTGRTHQIRVHLASIGAPVLCDRLYAGHARITRGQLLRRAARREPARPGDDEVLLERQALHAHRLSLRHPVTDTPMTWIAPLPADMQTVLDTLQESD